jgi:hypothetical protein
MKANRAQLALANHLNVLGVQRSVIGTSSADVHPFVIVTESGSTWWGPYRTAADARKRIGRADSLGLKVAGTVIDLRKLPEANEDNPFPLLAALGAIGAKRNPIDSFTLRHLATWIDNAISEDERNTAREVIFEQLIRDPEATDRGLSWREIYDIGLRNRNRKPLDTSASRFAKPERRKRTRSKSNPAPVANPAPIPKLALLGTVEEIVIQSHARRSTLRPRGALLLVSADARTIVIARPSSSAACKVPSDSTAARKMFERWSQFKSDRAVRLDLSDKPLTVDLGSAQVIRYRSDKWSGKPTLYEHVFSGKTTAIADSYRAPRMIRIDGDPPRVLVTDRGIVG